MKNAVALPGSPVWIWLLALILWFTWGDRGLDVIAANQAILGLRDGVDVQPFDRPLLGHAIGPFIFAPAFIGLLAKALHPYPGGIALFRWNREGGKREWLAALFCAVLIGWSLIGLFSCVRLAIELAKLGKSTSALALAGHAVAEIGWCWLWLALRAIISVKKRDDVK